MKNILLVFNEYEFLGYHFIEDLDKENINEEFKEAIQHAVKKTYTEDSELVHKWYVYKNEISVTHSRLEILYKEINPDIDDKIDELPFQNLDFPLTIESIVVIDCDADEENSDDCDDNSN
jgi:hypothetical protein